MNKVMVTFKRFRSLGLAGLCFTVCLLAAPAAQAQLVEATILTTNVDVAKRKLYVEMNYTPRACGQYQLRFKYKTLGDPAGKYALIKLDSVITNNTGTPKVGTYKLAPTVEGGVNITVLNLDNTAVGGYNLRFEVLTAAGAIDPAELPQVCMETYKLAYRSKRTGAGEKDEVFTSRDILPGCPYTGDDVVACRQRTGGAKNWEAFVQDPRDCNVYHVVQIGNKWWFAQNLNYQKDLAATQEAAAQNVRESAFFCPGRREGVGTVADEWAVVLPAVPNGRWSCEIYGALYTWNTARAIDGGTPGAVNTESTPTSTTTTSAIRGICPPGWFLPNDADWGIMLNNMDECKTPENSIDQLSPLPVTENCSHFATSNDAASASDIVQLSTTTPVANAVLNSYPLGKAAGRWSRAAMCENASPLYCDNAALNATMTPPAYGTRWAQTEESGADIFGFKVLPAGYRFSDNTTNGKFYGRGEFAIFLSSTRWSDSEQSPVLRMVKYNESGVRRGYVPATTAGTYNAYSVRCLR
jgi:uncharacterized protein (TIGR02145 family)